MNILKSIDNFLYFKLNISRCACGRWLFGYRAKRNECDDCAGMRRAMFGIPKEEGLINPEI